MSLYIINLILILLGIILSIRLIWNISDISTRLTVYGGRCDTRYLLKQFYHYNKRLILYLIMYLLTLLLLFSHSTLLSSYY